MQRLSYHPTTASRPADITARFYSLGSAAMTSVAHFSSAAMAVMEGHAHARARSFASLRMTQKTADLLRSTFLTTRGGRLLLLRLERRLFHWLRVEALV